MADLVLTTSVLEETRVQIENTLINAGVNNVLLIDEAGNIVVACGRITDNLDTTSLAVLAAANFGATSQIAKLIGEDNFTLLFHKGKKDSIHVTRISTDLILVTIFGDNVSLGLIRLRVAQLAKSIEKTFGQK
ncbi:MAG: roadblock/LC7 domain-containing protein [Thermodesulfobacteriota bacterium]|nr:roadblock/LC7 domain-containing protein [Thermodesulfobacteriota bacterium]